MRDQDRVFLLLVRKYVGKCDRIASEFATFTNDVTVTVDLVNVGDCRVRVRLLRRGKVERRAFVDPDGWTDPPLEMNAIREVEFSCRPRELEEDGRCAFAYTITAEGRHRGQCAAENAPARPRAEFKQPMDLVVIVENRGECDLRIRFYRRAVPGGMKPLGK